MRTRSFIFCLGLLLVAASYATAQGPELEKATSFGGSSIRLPKGWLVKASSDTSLTARAPAADKESADPSGKPPQGVAEYAPAVSIKVQGYAGEIDPAAQQKVLVAGIDGYRSVETPAPVTIGEAKGYMFGGTFLFGKLQLRSRHYLLTMNNKLYVIAFTTLASRWQDHQEEFEASAKSFVPGK